MGSSKIKNIIFPIEFDHFTGGMIHSVMDLAVSLTGKYDIYILAAHNAEVLSFDSRFKKLSLRNGFTVSAKRPVQTLITYIEIRLLLHRFHKEDTLIVTNNVGSELIFSGFGFLNIPYQRMFVSRGGDYKGFTGNLIRRGFRHLKKFIATSKHQKEVLCQLGITGKDIVIINNGIDVDTLNYKYELDETGAISISVVGYINENKNQVLAVEVLYTLRQLGRNVVLNIYGDAFSDGDRAYLSKLVKCIKDLQLDKYVFFRGFVSDLFDIYSNTDILLSCSFSEGFGRTIVEGMAFGIPCIAMKDAGGPSDILTNTQNGFLVSPDVNEIASIITKLIINAELRTDISNNAIATYKSRFTSETMCSYYGSVLENI